MGPGIPSWWPLPGRIWGFDEDDLAEQAEALANGNDANDDADEPGDSDETEDREPPDDGD